MMRRIAFSAVVLLAFSFLALHPAQAAFNCKMDLKAAMEYMDKTLQIPNAKSEVLLTLTHDETVKLLALTNAPDNITGSTETMAVVQVSGDVMALVPLTGDGCAIPFSDTSPLAAMINSTDTITQYLIAIKSPSNGA